MIVRDPARLTAASGAVRRLNVDSVDSWDGAFNGAVPFLRSNSARNPPSTGITAIDDRGLMRCGGQIGLLALDIEPRQRRLQFGDARAGHRLRQPPRLNENCGLTWID